MSNYVTPDALAFQQRVVQQMVDHYLERGQSVDRAVARTQQELIDSCRINWERLTIDSTSGEVSLFTQIGGRSVTVHSPHSRPAAPTATERSRSVRHQQR